MKVVFMGTPEFAAICLEEIIQSKHQIVGVVSIPDKAAGRGQKIRESAVTKLAKEHQLPLFQPEKLKNPDFIHDMEALNADVFVVVAFRMLPKEIWQIPPKGTFNLHASLLPQYRGAAPINWAIINGEKESGVTTFLIDEQIDTGTILLNEKIAINENTTAGDLHDDLAEIGKKLIIKTLDGLETNSIQARKQDSKTDLKPAPKLFKEDCEIDWTQNIGKIHNTIRGLSPYPGAWTHFYKNDEQKFVKILKTEIEPTLNDSKKINSIQFEKNSIIIHLKDGNLHLKELQAEGKRPMNAQDFSNGWQDKSGWTVIK
ncbi:MAG: methionyl-tRNA formyltransferase [Weeksellaceae bacterium]|jgi:methionyl-tRNA formyltransferase|nr:methionyl-tRNA formyltransferase [Weeksellaceae bacterium]MDX9704981.1 methionyl-tRNA formyltransferase [Weeksellaceae bacterium]